MNCIDNRYEIFEGQSFFDIRLNIAMADTSGITDQWIEYIKPDDERGEWSATLEDGEVVYSVADGDIDQAGDWMIRAKVQGDNDRIGYGTYVKMIVKCNL